MDIDNLISGSSALSKSSLNFWKFMVYVLLKVGLENFERCFTSVWDECNFAVVWSFFGIAFLWDSFPGGSEDKASACNARDPGSIPGLGRCPGEGNGNPLQYSCLENPRTEEPGGLPSLGSHRVGHDWCDLAAAAALLTMPKSLTGWTTTNCGKFWKRWEYQTTWPASWEICMQLKKQQLELDTWNNRLVPNRERSTSRLYIVTLLI